MGLSKSTLFDPILVNKVIDGVKGKSALAVLANQEPVIPRLYLLCTG